MSSEELKTKLIQYIEGQVTWPEIVHENKKPYEWNIDLEGEIFFTTKTAGPIRYQAKNTLDNITEPLLNFTVLDRKKQMIDFYIL